MRRRAAVVVSVLVVRPVRAVALWLWHLNWKEKFYLAIITSCTVIVAVIAIQIVFYITTGE